MIIKMVKLDIKSAATFIKDDPKWIMKIGVFFAIQIVISLLSTISQYSQSFIDIINQNGSQTTYYNNSQLDFSNWEVLSLIILVPVGLLSIVYSIYFTGYSLETSKNVMNGVEKPLATHDDIVSKLKLWGAIFLFALIPLVISTLIFIGFVVLAYFGTDGFNSSLGNGDGFAELALFLMFFFGFIIFLIIFMMLFSIFFITPMTYIYMASGSLGEAFNMGRVFTVAKSAWFSFLMVVLLGFALGVLSQIVVLLSYCCLLGWLVGPIAQVWLTFTMSHLNGQVFKQLKEQGL